MAFKNLISVSMIILSSMVFISDQALGQIRLRKPDYSKVDLRHVGKDTVYTDYNWQFTALDGSSVNLRDLRDGGIKVVFLNVWATWCRPCVEEMPGLQKLYDQMKNEVVFVLISIDNDTAAVADFLKKNNYTMPVYWSGAPPKEFDYFGTPTTFIVAPDGRIVFKQVGAVDWDNQETVDFLRNSKRLIY